MSGNGGSRGGAADRDPAHADEIRAELAAVVGAANVLTAAVDTEAYTTSARRQHGRCLAVVRPGATNEVAAVVRICNAHGLCIVPQGGNTGLSDAATPASGDAILLNLSRMNRVIEVDPLAFTMTLETGVVLSEAQARAAAEGLLLPISLGAEGSCQIGGNISTNAGGRTVVRHGMARASVLGLEVVLPDGAVWNGLRKLRKDNTGYDLKQLFIGAEGTLGIVTQAVLGLQPAPRSTASAFASVAGPQAAIELLARLRAATGDCVNSFEIMNRYSMEVPLAHMLGAVNPFGSNDNGNGNNAVPDWAVIIELASSRPADPLDALLESALSDAMEADLVLDAAIAQNSAQSAAFWRLRDEGTAFYWKEGGYLLHDPSVPIPQIPGFIERVHAEVEAISPGARVSAFGHIGDGNIHVIVSQPADADKRAFIALGPRIHAAVYGAAMALGGSFSAEHGVGELKKSQLAHFAQPEGLALMRALKQAIDPAGRMNPGKVFDMKDGATND